MTVITLVCNIIAGLFIGLVVVPLILLYATCHTIDFIRRRRAKRWDQEWEKEK